MITCTRTIKAFLAKATTLVAASSIATAGLLGLSSTVADAAPNPLGPTISRDTVLQRAQQWINESVPYSQSHHWTDSNGIYRQDCSGFISMAWDLNTTSSASNWGLTTNTLPSVATRLGGFGQLQPGDMIDSVSAGHVVLFVGWADSGHTVAKIDEERGTGSNALTTTMSTSYMRAHSYAPYRYNKIRQGAPGVVATAAASSGTGYYELSSAGGVYAYGAPFFGSAAGQDYFAGHTAVALGVAPNGSGYWILSSDGGIYAYGAPFFGAAAGNDYFAGHTAVALGVAPNGSGYWILSSDGGIYAYGAPFHGAAAGNDYFAGHTATALGVAPNGSGYWILSSDGGIYAYGTPFAGGPAGQSYFAGLTASAIISAPDSNGYWVESSAGGMYAYGSATYRGSGI